MDALEAIFTRASIRKFTEQSISEEDLRTILRAGMAGPSAVNARPYSFLVVRERQTLDQMAEINLPGGIHLKGAPLAILVAGDMSRTFEKAPEFWVIDCSIACQNMILAAHALGIGSVWLGTWPQEGKVEGQKELFHLPEGIVPHSIIAFGYPAKEEAEKTSRGFYEEDRVHLEKW